jgi:S-adenosylmethionine:tRNA ribosyltransferase-isomerase
MSSPKQLNILDFSFVLPNEKIAKFPLENRDESKLLIYKNATISDGIFKQIDTYLPENSLVVFNNTRVVHARLLFNRLTGAQIEIFCIEPLLHLDYQQAFVSKQTSTWKCMVGNAKKWKEDWLEKQVETPLGDVILKATKKENTGGTQYSKEMQCEELGNSVRESIDQYVSSLKLCR